MADATEVFAKTRYLSMSPQKVRLVLDLVRGMAVTEAMEVLDFTNRAAARPVYKLIHSAVANAEENMGISREDLVIHQIFADQGPTRNWRRFGARGRFKPIRRRSSHVSVILREKEVESS